MKTICLIAVVCLAAIGYGQDSASQKPKWEVNGYLKNMQHISFDHLYKQDVSGNLLHNRINLKWMPADELTVVAQLRNRMFWGEEIKRTPQFVTLLRNSNEKLNMQVLWINSPSVIMHSNTERLYIDYRKEKLNARLGRQRINWGVSTTWNPNDVFNSYNFLDFDYEERSGVDAAKLQYQFSDFGTVELAYASSAGKKGDIVATRFSANKWNYDLHAIAGIVQQQVTIGAGWAGSIKESGFKGELQYYFTHHALKERLNIVLEWDRVFKKGWYTNASVLYNSRGIDTVVSNFYTIDLKLSPQNLMPTKWNLIATASKEITPLLSANTSVLYTPGTNLLILLPSLRYDLATNLTADLIGQSFFAQQENRFRAISTRCFLRIKWNF